MRHKELKISAELADRLEAMANEEGITVSDLVDRLLWQEWIKDGFRKRASQAGGSP